MTLPSELADDVTQPARSRTASASLSAPLRGITVPMITPLRDRDTLDVDGLERLIEHILDGGVHGLFVLGTTGEGPSLSYRLRKELIERTCRQVGDRVPVLVGVTDTAFAESVRVAGWAADSGAAGVVVAPPYYFSPSQVELLEYLEHLVSEMPLPLFLYNLPSHTNVPLDLETVRRAADRPGIIGLKDSSQQMTYFQLLVSFFADRPDFTLLVGPEELLGESVLLGGHGGVNGGANLYPQLYVRLYRAAQNRDLDRLLALHREVMQISQRIYHVGQYASSYLKGLKCALSLLGICDDFMAEPFHRFTAPERERVEQQLRELGLLT